MNIKSYQPRKLSIPVTEIEQASFCRLDDNLRSKTLEEEFKSGVKWQKVPTRYLKLSPEEIDSEVFQYEVGFFEFGQDSDTEKIYSLETSSEDKINGWTIQWNSNIEIDITVQVPQEMSEDEIIDLSKLQIESIDDLDSEPGYESEEISISPVAMENIKKRVLKVKG